MRMKVIPKAFRLRGETIHFSATYASGLKILIVVYPPVYLGAYHMASYSRCSADKAIKVVVEI